MSLDDIPCDQFVCEACGADIISMPPIVPPPTKCATCTWIDAYIDPWERDAVRARLCGAETWGKA
jgi:hypothetical protein